MGARFAQGVDDVLNMNVGDAARKGARVVRGAADAVKDATVAAMKNPVARVAGKVAQPLVLMDQANETFKTPTDEMYRRYGFDENDSSFMHDVGVRGLDFLQGVGNTVTFGVADRLGNLMAGNGFVRSPRYRDSVTETVVDPTNGAMPPPPKENADKSGDAAAQPSLRDMMLARLQNIDRVAATNGGLGMRYWNNARNEAVNSLTELDKADTMAGATMANLRATAGNKVREDADKRISERFQIPVYDNDGKIKGYEKDPNAANALRDFAAQIYGMDYYSLPQAQQDVVMQAYDVNSRGTRRLNERLASEGGGSARVSMLPRVGANSLRNDGEISFGDIGDPNISLNDWLTSFGPNQMEKMVLRDPVTGQRVAARHVLRNESGTIDDDLIAQINSAAAAQVKKQK